MPCGIGWYLNNTVNQVPYLHNYIKYRTTATTPTPVDVARKLEINNQYMDMTPEMMGNDLNMFSSWLTGIPMPHIDFT